MLNENRNSRKKFLLKNSVLKKKCRIIKLHLKKLIIIREERTRIVQVSQKRTYIFVTQRNTFNYL